MKYFASVVPGIGWSKYGSQGCTCGEVDLRVTISLEGKYVISMCPE